MYDGDNCNVAKFPIKIFLALKLYSKLKLTLADPNQTSSGCVDFALRNLKICTN